MKAEIIEAITAFADRAHGTQTRKYTGERYIVHPVQVMRTCGEYTQDPAVLAAALLHDVLEDTPVKEDEIRDFLNTVLNETQVSRTVSLVHELTDVYTKSAYPRLNRKRRKRLEFERLSQISPEGQTIKYADVMDNSVNIIQHDADFGYVFLQEARALLEMMPAGDQRLYERVKDVVDKCLNTIKGTIT
jgi:guanosine-3',5'-bis(diphosphate) 3'-pyrophosphohydrolase